MLDTTLIKVKADFFQSKNEVAFKAQKADYALRKAEDFTLSSNVDYKKNTLKFFDDDKQVSISVSDKTLNFLQKHFYSGNFIALKDNSIALRGDAAVFVEGWYKDIAYNRGFLANNLNQNASIEGAKEHIGFKNSITRDNSVNKEGDYFVFTQSKNFAYQNGKINDKTITIDELMDITLQSDKNRDGEITFLEAYAGKDKLTQGYENWLNSAMREHFGDENININTYGIISKRFANNAAMAVGLYENIFEGSLYGGTNTLNAQRFSELKEDLTPKIDTENEGAPNVEAQKEPKDDEKEKELLAKYPEFKFLIQAKGAENISEAELAQLRKKQQISLSYQSNSTQINLKDEFSQSVFETNFFV